MLLMFAYLGVESDVVASDMHVVCEFPVDICDFPSEREVEIRIDLVPGTRPVSMTPDRLFVS